MRTKLPYVVMFTVKKVKEGEELLTNYGQLFFGNLMSQVGTG